MKPIPTSSVASLRGVSWLRRPLTMLLLLVSLMATLHRDGCCVMGGSANGAGPWGIGNGGANQYYQHNQRNQHRHHQHRELLPLGSPLVVLPFSQGTSTASRSLAEQQVAIASGVPRGGYEHPIERSGNGNGNGMHGHGYGYGYDSLEYPAPPSSFVRIIGTITQLLISTGKAVLPPVVAVLKGILVFYRALPVDAIKAQIGLVYCFLGGYYPTLFSSLQAAKYCGWNIMVGAVSDLTEEAMVVVDELEDSGVWDDDNNKRDLFLKQTHIVLATVDPAKINTAAGALYTTWLGISTILRKEYARVINLSLTLAEGMEKVATIVLVPALNLVIPRDYHRWVPVVMGWSVKAAAMRVAWRIERVLTASTSAIAGGAMVARSLTRLLAKHRRRRSRRKTQQEQQNGRTQQQQRRRRRRRQNRQGRMVVANTNTTTDHGGTEDCDDDYNNNELSIQEQVAGFAVGGLGFYTQMECQYRNHFSFVVPFPLSLVTWPFDLAERWIQWYITERTN